jgi:penicillin-binding protein 2
MRHRLISLLFPLAVFLTACQALAPFVDPQDPAELPSPTPAPTETSSPPAPGDASQTGLTFFKTWEAGDYAGMHSLLSPQSQALVDLPSFTQRYRQALDEARVTAIRTQPLAARQEADRAEMTVRATWESVILGEIVRDHTVELVYRDERWGVVWHEGLILPELAGGNRLRLELQVPSRANIYDVNGRALAYQGTAITLGVVPGQIQDEPALLATISPLLGETPEALQERYAEAQPDWYVPLGDVSAEVMQENLLSLQPFLNTGLLASDRRSRLYPENGVAPHVIGYTGPIPAEQVDAYLLRGYLPDEEVGLAGIEAWAEPYLAGKRGGRLLLIDSAGEQLSVIQESAAEQARSIYTSLDLEFQQGVEAALASAVETWPEGRAGAVVVLEVRTGAVLATASYPTYNPAVFDAVRPNAAAELNQVLYDPRQPLLNRAIQGQYPQGSVFKLITLAAGLQSGLYTYDSRYTSTGVWSRLGEVYAKTDWREGGHGTVSYRTAVVVSCNTCFYDMGFEVNAVDSTLLPRVAVAFGLGAPTAVVGLPASAEAPGLIPSPEWKLAAQGEGWAPGDAVNMAIGQGYVLVTPIQAANFMAAIANGGTLHRPSLIHHIGAAGSAPEETWPVEIAGQLPYSPADLETLQGALRDVASGPFGTATDKFATLSIPVAGKTGTAEAPPGNSHAWFVGYAPAAPTTLSDGTTIEAPEIAIAVIMENAGEGSAVAAPIFRRVVELYYGLTPLTPYWWGES